MIMVLIRIGICDPSVEIDAFIECTGFRQRRQRKGVRVHHPRRIVVGTYNRTDSGVARNDSFAPIARQPRLPLKGSGGRAE